MPWFCGYGEGVGNVNWEKIFKVLKNTGVDFQVRQIIWRLSKVRQH